jgi:hypothetical protein
MNKKANIIIKKIEGEEVKILAKIFSVEESQFKIIDEEKGVFEAYVSVFGNVDSYGEVVEKGAFVEWLNLHKGRYPKGVWAHDWSEPIIKTLEIGEDDYGLKVKGQFVLEVQRAREIYALMKEGVITDFSFGFRVQEDAWDEVAKVRRLKKIAIYEYSPVLVGANDQATLIGVKSAEETETETPSEDAPSGDAPEGGEDNSAAGDSPAPSEETPAPVADVDAGVIAPEESSDPAPESEETPAPSEEGKQGVAPSKKTAIALAVDALRKAADALEAAETATEDEDPGKSSDTSSVEKRDGKGTTGDNVVRAILRDARKADKIIEKVILRAKEISQ